jgi:hypothetical protein
MKMTQGEKKLLVRSMERSAAHDLLEEYAGKKFTHASLYEKWEERITFYANRFGMPYPVEKKPLDEMDLLFKRLKLTELLHGSK